MNSQLGISIHNVGIDFIANKNFKRAQLCHKFSGSKQITSLLRHSKKNSTKITYHSPVFHQADPNDTYYLSSNDYLREATFEILEMNLKMASNLNTEEVVVHFASQDLGDTLSDKELLTIASDSIKRLSDLSIKYNVPIYIEYFGYNDKFYNPEIWTNLVRPYNNLGISLDIGHLYISCLINGMDYFQALKQLTPYSKTIHLWNTRGVKDIKRYGHIPVHPSQSTEDGWIDIYGTLKIILSESMDIPIIFEPDFKYGDLEYINEGIRWIDNLINVIKKEYGNNGNKNKLSRKKVHIVAKSS